MNECLVFTHLHQLNYFLFTRVRQRDQVAMISGACWQNVVPLITQTSAHIYLQCLPPTWSHARGGYVRNPSVLINLTEHFNQTPSPTWGAMSMAPSSQTPCSGVITVCIIYTIYFVRLPFIPFVVFKNTTPRLMYTLGILWPYTFE